MGALILGVLGSFSFLGVASVGMFFVAAALISPAVSSSAVRPAAVLALVGFALLLFGCTATPVFYLGWFVIAGAIALAILAASRTKTRAG